MYKVIHNLKSHVQKITIYILLIHIRNKNFRYFYTLMHVFWLHGYQTWLSSTIIYLTKFTIICILLVLKYSLIYDMKIPLIIEHYFVQKRNENARCSRY